MNQDDELDELFDAAPQQAQTQCPDCSTVFRITAEDLEVAQGLARCGECGNVFNASASILEHPVPEPAEPQENLDLTFTPDDDSPPRTRFFLPEVHQEQPGRGAAGKTLWYSLNIVLALAFAGQLGYLARNSLAIVPGLRTPLTALCELAGCTIEARRDLNKLALLNRNVYSHPNVSGALIISATIINNASFSQAYPVLAVSMANVRGTALAQRDFRPEDYLPLADVTAGMTPGAPVSIALQVADPGSEAMTFELDFR